jgi:hypothetical protein
MAHQSAYCETCLPSSDDGNELFNIKFEDVGVKEEDVPVPSIAVKAEHEVSVLLCACCWTHFTYIWNCLLSSSILSVFLPNETV